MLSIRCKLELKPDMQKPARKRKAYRHDGVQIHLAAWISQLGCGTHSIEDFTAHVHLASGGEIKPQQVHAHLRHLTIHGIIEMGKECFLIDERFVNLWNKEALWKYAA